MRHLRLLVIAVASLAVVLWAAPVATAQNAGRVVTPDQKFDGLTGGDTMGEGWYQDLTLPPEINPGYGNGEQCLRLGRQGKVLLVIGGNPVTCTVPEGTAVSVIGITTFCDTAEPPPFFAVSVAAQRRCAMAFLKPITVSIELKVDGGTPVDLHTPDYEIFSPQRRVELLSENILGAPPGPATFTAFGWMAWVTDLPPGRHNLQSRAEFTDGTHHTLSPIVNVIRSK